MFLYLCTLFPSRENILKRRYSMYNLMLHIEYLLLRHNIVIVPGLGAFEYKRQSASYDERYRRWMPMSRELHFTFDLNVEDNALASSYSRRDEITIEEAQDRVEEDIKELISLLDRDGEVCVGNIGILQKEDNSIRFIPRFTPQQYATAMGYLPAYTSDRANVANEPSATNTIAEATEAEAPMVNNVEGENIEDNSGNRKLDFKRNYYIAINKIFAKSAACFLLVATIALTVVIPVSDNNRETKASILPVEGIFAGESGSDNKNERTSYITHPAPSADRVSSTDVEKNQTSTAINSATTIIEEGRYHAIVATFNSEDEAETFVRQHSDCGFILGILTSPTKSRVTAMSSASMEDLRQNMQARSLTAKFPEAWIWKN